jgi:1-deoxy-D-xylulose-5-phosphate synthase
MKDNLVRIDIKSIKDPNIVKTLNYSSLALLCHDIRKEIIEETSVYGGHLSSNLGVVELTVALFRFFNFPTDKLIFDVGHQCYTEKILTGRSLAHLNEKNGVSGFQRRDESLYDVYEAGHSSTALSAAEGFAVARGLKCQNYDIVAVVGDASIVNGLSFEALNSLGSRHEKVIVILNDNGMSISAPSGGLGKFFRRISTNHLYNSMKRNYRRALYRTTVGRKLYSFSAYLKTHVKSVLVPTTMFDDMGLTYIGPVDGHNIKALERAFAKAKNTTKTAVIHVRTIKGKGYSPAENDHLGYWHGVTPFDIATGKPLDMHDGINSWSHFFGDLTHEQMQKHPEAELVVPAMIRGSGLETCFDDFPSRCIDVGIAEEHAFTMSGAMAINGLHPIISIYSTFLQRAYDEIIHDCTRLNADLTVLIDRSGLAGKNGETHQGIYDEAFLKSIPGVTLSMPSTIEEATALYDLSMEKGHGFFGIRYPHDLMEQPKLPDELGKKLKFRHWVVRRPIIAKEKAIVAVGPLGYKLYELTEDSHIPFVDACFLNTLDLDIVNKLLKTSQVVIYDPYGTQIGFAESLSSALGILGYKGQIVIKAIPNVFVQHASIKEQLEMFGLTPEQVLTLFRGDVVKTIKNS